jgi:DNA-binding PadR family transcriptional regulator
VIGYVAIKRLLDEGLITDAGKRVQEDRRVRKYYKLTGEGKKTLGAELAGLASLLSLPNVRSLIPRL